MSDVIYHLFNALVAHPWKRKNPQSTHCRHDDGKQVAIKLLTPLMGNTDGLHAFTTFMQEARMIHLKYPHIVPGL